MGDTIPFGGREYLILLALLLFARGMDFLSTWIATPNLALEANPIAKWLGWKFGLPLNALICLAFARHPLPAIVITTTSLLVAARNFQGAWLMRTTGEEPYRAWMGERLSETPPGLFLACLFGQTTLVALVGAALIFFDGDRLISTGIGTGLVAYALAVLVFTLFGLWRGRRRRM